MKKKYELAFLAALVLACVLFLISPSAVAAGERYDDSYDQGIKRLHFLLDETARTASLETFTPEYIENRIAKLKETYGSFTPRFVSATWHVDDENASNFVRLVDETLSAYAYTGAARQRYELRISSNEEIAYDKEPVYASIDIFAYDIRRKKFQMEVKLLDNRYIMRQDQIRRIYDIDRVDYENLGLRREKLSSHEGNLTPDGFAHMYASVRRELYQASLCNTLLVMKMSLDKLSSDIETLRAREKWLDRLYDKMTFSETSYNVIRDRLTEEQDSTSRRLAELESKEPSIAAPAQNLLAMLPEAAKGAFVEKDVEFVLYNMSLYPESIPAAYSFLVQHNFDIEISVMNNANATAYNMFYYWQTRYDLKNGESKKNRFWDHFDSLKSTLANYNLELMPSLDRDRMQIKELVGILEDQLVSADPGTAAVIHGMRDELLALADVVDITIDKTNEACYLTETLLREIEINSDSPYLAYKVEQTLLSHLGRLQRTVILEKEGYSLTLGELAVALLFAFAGYFISKLLSHTVKWILIHVLRRDATVASAVQKLLLFVFWTICIIISLNVLNIPLAVFAFILGILAVAVGLGAKDTVDATITGIIIMFGRYVRIGDIIEVSGVSGKVLDIGYRSIKIRTEEDSSVIIPTTDLTRSNIVNYTLSDTGCSDSIRVSVDICHDREEIKDLLRRVLDRVDSVEKTPEPYVRISDFSEHHIEYELCYWYDMADYKHKNVASRIREEILQTFAEKDIKLK